MHVFTKKVKIRINAYNFLYSFVFYSLCYDVSKKVKISIVKNCRFPKLFFQYYFSLPKLCTVPLHFNFITPGWHQIKARQLKMSTILEPLKAFHISWFVILRYFAYFLKKLVRAVLHFCRFALVVPGPFPRLKIEDNCFTAIAGWIPTS